MNNTNNNQQRGNYQQRQGNQQQQNGGQPERLKKSIDVVPEDFGGTMKTEMMTTMDLAGIVNSIFRPVMADYEGCAITGDTSNGSLYLNLFFKDKGAAPQDTIKNLVNAINTTNGASPMQRIQRMDIRNANKTYDLTEDTKDILSEFIYIRNNQKINWNQHILEVVNPIANGHQIFVKVVGLDLIRILRKKYGKKVNGTYNDYQINMLKPLTQGYNNGDNTNYLINVIQLDTNKVEALCQKIGMIPNQGNISMVRA